MEETDTVLSGAFHITIIYHRREDNIGRDGGNCKKWPSFSSEKERNDKNVPAGLD